MTYKKLFLSLLILPLAGFVWIIGSKNHSPEFKKANPLGVSDTIIRSSHPLTFFDKDTFYQAVWWTENEDKTFPNPILGAIIPHHLFPSFIIADFFNRLSKQNPKTIILIGPNHYERGSYKVLSSMYGWETPFGTVEPNEQIIRELERIVLIKTDEINLPKEHSVAGIMPFIEYYIPDAKVVPLVLSGFMTKEEVKLLSGRLKDYIRKDTVIIAAVDFSHYLTNQAAQEKDRITSELMDSFDYERLISLNNNYLDSPPSIATLLMAMQSLGSTKMQVLHHTNSGELQKDNFIETTSYFSIAYY